MDTVQLQRIIENDVRTQRQFLGVFSADTLPTHMPARSLAIVNCCKQHLPGIHWLAVSRGDNGTLEVFDSFGLPPHVYNILLPLATVMSHNTCRIQSFDSEVCGQYCLYYCYFKARGYDINDIISIFSSDYHNNDRYVYENVLKLYNI